MDLKPADDESPLPRASPTVSPTPPPPAFFALAAAASRPGELPEASFAGCFLDPKSMREMMSNESSGMLSLLTSTTSPPGPPPPPPLPRPRLVSLSRASLGEGASTAAARDRAASSCRRKMSARSWSVPAADFLLSSTTLCSITFRSIVDL